jgi:hypothetical protein
MLLLAKSKKPIPQHPWNFLRHHEVVGAGLGINRHGFPQLEYKTRPASKSGLLH